MTPKKLFTIIIGILGAVVVAGGVGYYYALMLLHNTSAQLATQQAEQLAAEDRLTDLNQVRNRYNREVKPILGLMDQALPRSKNQTEILSQLQTIARESGLTITSVAFPGAAGLPSETTQTIKSGQVLALPITFDVNGNFTQLQTFLGKVEGLSRFTNVASLTVTRPDKTKPIIYSMTVNAYVKP